MKLNKLKIFITALFVLPLLALAIFNTKPVGTIVSANTDAADTYKKSCAVCHKATAEKFFDLEKPDAEHVEIILKGKKGEKPPFMPGYETKGITAEQAQELVTYMRKLREPAN